MDRHHPLWLLPGQRGTQGPTAREQPNWGARPPAPGLPAQPGLERTRPLCLQLWPEQGIQCKVTARWRPRGLRDTRGRRRHRAAQPTQQGPATSLGGPRVTQGDGSGFSCLNVGRRRPRVRASACPLSASAGLPHTLAFCLSSRLRPGPLLRTPLLSSWDRAAGRGAASALAQGSPGSPC